MVLGPKYALGKRIFILSQEVQSINLLNFMLFCLVRGTARGRPHERAFRSLPFKLINWVESVGNTHVA